MTDGTSWRRLTEVARRLSAVSRENRYNVYEAFDWPPEIAADRYWMSPELMSCHGTPVWAELSEEQLLRLSRHEAVHFFSLNVHLIRELIGAVADRIYTTRYPGLSEYFHDFIAEENVHAWFFASFCQRYGGGVYPARQVSFGPGPDHEVLRDLAVFGRILVAEELCDVFNTVMAQDHRLPPIVREINRVHHEDEARHIAFGRQIMRTLRDEADERVGPERLRQIGDYLARYISTCLRSFYRTEVYADAGLPDPSDVRRRVMADPARRDAHQRGLHRTVSFLDRIGIVDADRVAW